MAVKDVVGDVLVLRRTEETSVRRWRAAAGTNAEELSALCQAFNNKLTHLQIQSADLSVAGAGDVEGWSDPDIDGFCGCFCGEGFSYILQMILGDLGVGVAMVLFFAFSTASEDQPRPALPTTSRVLPSKSLKRGTLEFAKSQETDLFEEKDF